MFMLRFAFLKEIYLIYYITLSNRKKIWFIFPFRKNLLISFNIELIEGSSICKMIFMRLLPTAEMSVYCD